MKSLTQRETQILKFILDQYPVREVYKMLNYKPSSPTYSELKQDIKPLAKRETQILKMLLAGYKSKEISQILKIHQNTVSSTIRQIKAKWQVNNLVELVKEAIKQGYLELEDDEPIG